MSVNLEYKARKYLIFKMAEIERFAWEAMRKHAPAKGRPSPNQYNMSENNLINHIERSRHLWTVDVYVDEGAVPYAQYADKGRGIVRAKNAPYLKFKGADGRIHVCKAVGIMHGWEFTRKAADEVRYKYGG